METQNNNSIAYSYRRFSTPEQQKGDSIRRQTELSDNWCAKNGITLNTNLSIEDLGVSAFDSSNIEKGNLGAFLEAIKRGKVPRGSYLLVESLDRLSRADVFTALKLFINILDEGIVIVTLGDDMEYSQERIANNNWTDLIISLTIMSRANEESKTKSKRLKAAASSKRDQAREGKILTKNCPQWIRYNEQDQKFELIPERAEVVQKIFTLSSEGIGGHKISSMLNEQQIPPFGRSKYWVKSNVSNMIASRTAIGEFQPHERINKQNKREARGEAIIGYYPAAISTELFEKSEQSRLGRRTNHDSIGRKGENFTNLFSRLTKCPYCTSTMVVSTRKRIRKRLGDILDKRFYCIGTKSNGTCHHAGIEYNNFESQFLKIVTNLDLSEIINLDDNILDRVKDIQNSIKNKEKAYKENKKTLDKIAEQFLTSNDLPSVLIQKMHDLEAQQKEIIELIKSDESNIITIHDEKERAKTAQKDMASISALMNDLKGDELYRLRARLHKSIKSLVQKIYLYPSGNPDIPDDDSQFAIVKFKGNNEKYYRMLLKAGTKKDSPNIENAICTGGKFLPYPEDWND